jgi:hypothetical protein
MRLAAFFILLLLAGCAADAPADRPDDVLDHDKFVLVMTDVQLLEATSRKKLIRDGDPKERTAQFYKQLFDKHEITEEEFKRSYLWWNSEPELMVEVYEKVLENLSRLEEETKPGKN